VTALLDQSPKKQIAKPVFEDGPISELKDAQQDILPRYCQHT
jgi:hypothetical protein